MRILNEQGEEITEEDVNSEDGYLAMESIVTEHHEATPEIQEKGHYYPKTYYFEDGTRYDIKLDGDNNPIEDDIHVQANEDGVSFSYIPQGDEEEKDVRGVDVAYIIDVEHQPAKEAYDDTEQIQRYYLYTEEQKQKNKEAKELQEKQETFITTGPERLDTVETNIDDMTVIMAEMIGV